MKKFNRVLAMLLALVTVLAILPVSAFADAWLKVDTDKEKVENVTTTDITVTVDPKALLSYLQDGDIKGLLTGISASGSLSDIMTKSEFSAIVPKDRILNLVKAIIADIDIEMLISYVGVEKLLACADKDALIELFTELPNLQDYVKDTSVLMAYVNVGDIANAIDLIKTDLLIEDHADALMKLAMDLDSDDLLSIVDINAAVKLEGIDLAAAAQLDYFRDTITYPVLADSYLIKANLDIYVNENYERLSVVLPDYIQQDAMISLFAGIEDKLFSYMIEENAKEIGKAAVKGAIDGDPNFSDFDYEAVLPYVDVFTQSFTDFEGALAAGVLASLYDEFLNGYDTIPAAFIVEQMVSGADPLFDDITVLIDEGVILVQDLIEGGHIDVAEMITRKVIDIDRLADAYTYENLVDIDEIKDQIVEGMENDPDMASDVIDCIVKTANGQTDYALVVNTLGIEAIIDALSENGTSGLDLILDNYVTDVAELISTLDIDTIANQLMSEGNIGDIFDVMAMVEAVGMPALVGTMDLQKAVTVVYESGAIQALIGSLDFESYIVPLFSIFSAIMYNITEIEIDGVVVTEQDKQDNGYLKLLPGKLVDALENLVPTLTELSNIDDSGKLFTASFAISYRDGDAIKTKALNFNFVLTAGTDNIRKVASKLAILMDKIGTIGFADGKFVADVKIPSEFASVLRLALEKMADSNDPEFNALKDKVLAVYDQSPSDLIAFAEGLTIEEVVAVLEAVNPAIFGKVYNKALSSRYAQVLLAYVEAKTGYDFSDNLEAQNLINTIENIPTFEVFVEKLESVTGFEITDRLPAKVNGYLDNTVYDVIDKLADRFGVDFDLYDLLKKAAASSDPFAYLYTAVVNKVETSGAIYNAVKVRALKVVNRLMATRFGAVIADNCLMDFYRGNSAFVFEKSVTFDAKALLEKGINKAFNVLGSYTNRLEGARQYVKELLDIIVDDGAYVTTGFDITVRVSNLYRVTYKNEMGAPILTTLLPAGTNLNKMLDYASRFGADFNGWMDEETGKCLTKMPAKDVVVQADIQGITYHTVTVIAKINGEIDAEKVATIQVKDGDILGDYQYALNNAAKSLYPALTADQRFLGYTYAHKAWGTEILDTVVEDSTTVLYADIYLNEKDGHIRIPSLGDGFEYKVILTDDACTIQVKENWNQVLVALKADDNPNNDTLYFNLSTAFMGNLSNRNLVFTGADAQKVTISAAKVAEIASIAQGKNADDFGFSYDFANGQANGFVESSTAESYELLFAMQNNPVNLGNFAKGEVVVELPFAGKFTTDERTFVYVDSVDAEGNPTRDTLIAGEGDLVAVNNGKVIIDAPHFSEFTIVNKYHLILDTASYLEGTTEVVPGLGSIAVVNGLLDEDISTVNGANGYWYEAGREIEATIVAQNIPGYEYAGTKATMNSGSSLDLTVGEVKLPMPAEAVTVCHYAKASVYNINYYVNGNLEHTDTYTFLDKPADADAVLNAFKPETAVEGDGWYWYSAQDIATVLTTGGDLNLFWVNDNETEITVEFYVNDVKVEFTETLKYTIPQLRAGAVAELKNLIDSKHAGYNWYTITGEGDSAVKTYLSDNDSDLKNDYVNNYAALVEFALLNNNVARFDGEKNPINYHVYTDGNATVDKSDATAGTTVIITVANKVGYNAVINVYETTDGSTLGELVAVNDKNEFVMPASNVIVKITYNAIVLNYIDKDGNTVQGNYGDTVDIVVSIPAGSTLKAEDLTTLATAPAGLTLVKVERGENGALILTYRCELTAGGINVSAFLAEVNLLIAAAEYTQSWIVDGVTYTSETEALANIPAGMTFVKWVEISDNVFVATLESAKQSANVWLIVCIILAVLLLLAVIALIYVLHITDKIGASWLTKVCTAIVSAFFAFCMLVAKGILKLLNFVGIKDKDILEELPEEPVEDIPAAYVDPETVGNNEEATEEVTEEATEEIADAAIIEDVITEEAAPEVVEEAPAMEATEEVADAAILEDVAVEAAEEVPAEEATEEVVDAVMLEDVIVEATEEAPAMEATEEAAPEAVEEAPQEEVTEEVADAVILEDVVVEAAEEAPQEEATEEVAEDAVILEDVAVEAAEEAPQEEATEEAAEEVVEEAPQEEVTEEAAEEVVEEAPQEEVTEETTEEVAEEEKKDE